MKNLKKLSLALALSLGIGATTAQAQTASATINAQARILQALVVNGAQTLDFGDVLLGSTKVLAAANASSGQFTVQGATNAEVDINFTFPGTLASGANTLAVGSWTGLEGINTTRGASAGFNPNATFTRRLSTTGTDVLNLYLGGSVTSAGAEPAGTYTGIIQMDVAYTGN